MIIISCDGHHALRMDEPLSNLHFNKNIEANFSISLKILVESSLKKYLIVYACFFFILCLYTGIIYNSEDFFKHKFNLSYSEGNASIKLFFEV